MVSTRRERQFALFIFQKDVGTLCPRETERCINQSDKNFVEDPDRVELASCLKKQCQLFEITRFSRNLNA